MNVRIEESWRRCLQPEFDSPYFAELAEFVRHEYASCTVYPPARRIFHAFDSCPFDRVRAVIIGQDPYHEPGQYYGLCFSVLDGVPFRLRWSTYSERSRAIWASRFPLRADWSAGPIRVFC